MVKISLENESISLYFVISKNNEDYSLSDITQLLRYAADSIEKGNVVYDGEQMYAKAFKKENKTK